MADQPNSFENRRILLLNKVTLMAIGICLIVVTTHLLIANYAQGAMVSLSIFIVCIPTLLLQKRNKHRWARRWLLTGFFILVSLIFFHSIKLNLPTGTEYLLIVLIPLILVFLDGKNALFFASIVIIAGNGYLIHRLMLSDEFNSKVFFGLQINWLVMCFTVLFCVIFFKNSILRANELIEKDREKLFVANKTKNFLFAVISHDIRSPLNTLKQYLSLDPSQRRSPDQFMIYQKSLEKKVDEINQTLDDLLFWSKSQLEEMKNNPSSFLAEEVVKNVMMLNEEIIRKKGIELTISFETENQVWCDKDQLTVAVRNLVQNAIKFTAGGEKLAITTSNQEDMISISIADTGKGMDESTLKGLKEGLIVESNVGTAGEVGTGLGLSLVSEMISKNNGRLEVESTLGVGTEISIFVPKANQ
ncbi:MAG: sensor histidine kinase [Ekhidna sp.]